MNIHNYTREFSQNIRLAYPVVLGLLGHALIGIVDNYMIGRLGSTELAAVSLGNSFIFIAMSLGIGFSTAITPLVAKADAEQDQQKVKIIFDHGLLLCTFLGVFLFIITIFSKELMLLMHQPKSVVALASPYVNWVAFSLIPVIIYQGHKQFADGLSKTKFSMYAILITNIIHVILNYIFIYGFWFIPQLGIFGAALGTVLSRIFMVLFMHYSMKYNRELSKYFKVFSFVEIKKSMLKQIIQLGFPSAMQMLFEVALFTSAVWISGSLGKNNQAANQIALILSSSTFMVAMGLNVAAMIRVGRARGLQDYKQLLIVARSIFLLTVILEVGFALFFISFHKILPHFFLNMDNTAELIANLEIITITSKLLLVAAVFQISDGLQAVILGALRGLQDVKVPMYITFFAYWIIGFPVSFFLGKYTSLGAVGIWIGLLIGLTFAAVLLYLRFVKLTKSSKI